jgi:hypothetical protein
MAGSAHGQLAVRVLSDLHLEHAPLRIDWEGEDVLIIAGDVSPHPRHWRELLAHYETGAPDTTIVLLVAGNHDFYGRSVSQGLTEWRALASPRVRPLENDSVVIRGVRFWGATMWTDLDSAAPALLQACMRSLTDFDAISGFGPHEFVARHTESRDQLRHVLGSTPERLDARGVQPARLLQGVGRTCQAMRKRPVRSLAHRDHRLRRGRQPPSVEVFLPLEVFTENKITEQIMATRISDDAQLTPQAASLVSQYVTVQAEQQYCAGLGSET